MLHLRIITSPDRTATVLQELAKDPGVTHITARPVSGSASLGNDMEDRPFDWTRLGFCCAVAGEVKLRPATLQEAQRSAAYVPLPGGEGPLVFAHRRAYPMLVGRDIEVDCRRRLGVRSFSSSLPPDLGLRTWFGRETG